MTGNTGPIFCDFGKSKTVFTSVCQSSCPGGGGSMPGTRFLLGVPRWVCLVPGPFSERFPWYQVHSGRGIPGTRSLLGMGIAWSQVPSGGMSRRGGYPRTNPPPTLWTGDLAYPPTAPSATDGRYASYWNAFLLMCSSTNQNASWTRVDIYWNLLLRGSGDFYILKSQSGNILW